MKKNTLIINWPTSFFTIKDICDKHPNEKNITIRFRINRAIERNEIVCIGKNKVVYGRPTIVFVPCPVSTAVIQSAVNSGVILNESFEGVTVTVGKIDSSTSQGNQQQSNAVTSKLSEMSMA